MNHGRRALTLLVLTVLALTVALARPAVVSTVSANVSMATVTRGQLTVSYQDARDAQQLAAVFRSWQEAAADLRERGWPVPSATLQAARDAADFQARTGQPVAVAAITRGRTIQTQRLGALAQRGLLRLTVRHEAFHAAQDAAHITSWPRWLSEGLARLFSGEARADSPADTGLRSLSGAQLDQALLSREAARVALAYREASRRAALELRRWGWGRWGWARLREWRPAPPSPAR